MGGGKESAGHDRLLQHGRGSALFMNEIHLTGADILRPEHFRHLAEILRELGNPIDIDSPGVEYSPQNWR
jgi:hypothetical protein